MHLGEIETSKGAAMTDLSRATWRTSSRSGNGGNCVEVAMTSEVVGVRDSKDRAAGHFAAAPAQWSAFIDAVKTNRFD
ncbi:protein of unknown function [Actinopolyspora mzabensis]|uniref:DUF397 domain-containing protein n=2 Tax=Actinopolyspora mzabensis TaxID=995066 RepID=A0A1G9A6J4_ACTMZ|nr:protein of unknown function [Actinopolyspora mzabensis]